MRFAPGGTASNVWVARPDGTHRRLLARNAFSPAVSPDGRWVAYTGCTLKTGCPNEDDPRGVYLVPSRRGSPRLLARDATFPQWSPGSDLLLAHRGRTLLTLDVSSKHERVLARDAGVWAAFSPDGGRVAFVTEGRPPAPRCPGGGDLYVTGASRGSTLRLTRDGRSSGPVWGPGGIVFSRVPPGSCALGGKELWLARPGGGELRRLARLSRGRLPGGVYGLDALDWRGRSLLGAVSTEFVEPPLAVDPASGRFSRFGGSLVSAISLSRDGRRVLVMRGGAEPPFTIGWIPFGGGTFHPLVGGDVGQPSWNR